MIVLIWVYYSAQIFLLGAEFTWVYARTFGSMRGIDAVTNQDDAGAPTIPLRSEGADTTLASRQSRNSARLRARVRCG